MNRKLFVGDVFEVRIDAATKRLFQYVANDASQLNSHVVRVFEKKYGLDELPDLGEIINGGVDFHAHVLLGIGIKQKLWRKVGHEQPRGDVDILFRDTNDYGNPGIKVSKNWHVWKVNTPFEKIGELRPQYELAEVGVVVPPSSLIYRMQNAKYDFLYPGY